MTVMMDSGVRRGTDVLKALALGAQFVFVGRPFLYAAAVAGEPGVRHAIKLLETRSTRHGTARDHRPDAAFGGVSAAVGLTAWRRSRPDHGAGRHRAQALATLTVFGLPVLAPRRRGIWGRSPSLGG